jgi:hypothetical protein
MYLGLPVPHTDPLVRGTDPRIQSASGSVPKCHGSATLRFPFCGIVEMFRASASMRQLVFWFIWDPDPDADPLVRGTDPRTQSASGSVPKCHGSATLRFPFCGIVDMFGASASMRQLVFWVILLKMSRLRFVKGLPLV